MAEKFADRVTYQRLWNQDLDRQGVSIYDDQGIVFEGHHPIDAMRAIYLTHMGQTPSPGNPNGPGGGDDDDGRHRRSP